MAAVEGARVAMTAVSDTMAAMEGESVSVMAGTSTMAAILGASAAEMPGTAKMVSSSGTATMTATRGTRWTACQTAWQVSWRQRRGQRKLRLWQGRDLSWRCRAPRRVGYRAPRR